MTLIDVNAGEDLGTVTVRKCDKRSISEIAASMHETVSKVKRKEDEAFNLQTKILSYLPTLLCQLITQLTSFVSYNLSCNMPFLKFKRHQYGTVLLTNVSSFPGYYEVALTHARRGHRFRTSRERSPWCCCALRRNG